MTALEPRVAARLLTSALLRVLGGPGSGHFGHAGRPGEVGGSAPSEGGEPNEETRVKLERAILDEAEAITGIDLDQGADPSDAFGVFSVEDRGMVKEKIVEDLYKAQKVDEGLRLSKQDIQERLDLWATSSGDHNFESVLNQHNIKEEFGLSDAVVEHMADISDQLDLGESVGTSYQKQQIELNRKYARLEYDNTQAWLKSKGIDEVTVYRGQRGTLGLVGEDVEVYMQPASSWTTSLQTAQEFASSGKDDGKRSEVFIARIPASRILSTCVTGRGCLTEAEVLVLGGKLKVRRMGWRK